jgi:alkylated DNA repair dioxygenase AlkB
MINKIKQELQIKSFILNPKSPNQVLVNKYLKNDALGFHV